MPDADWESCVLAIGEWIDYCWSLHPDDLRKSLPECMMCPATPTCDKMAGQGRTCKEIMIAWAKESVGK